MLLMVTRFTGSRLNWQIWRTGHVETKFRGIAQSVPANDLPGYLHCLLKTLLPAAKDYELIINRAHPHPKPMFLPSEVPRDILAWIHFFHIKELAMNAARKQPTLPGKFKGIVLYADLSQHTIHARRLLLPITRALRDRHPLQMGISHENSG